MSEKVACPECGDEYKSLGNHWQHNESHRPALTPKQKEIAVGLLMGDGTIHRKGRIQCKMITKPYLEYLDRQFGCLGTGVRFRKTAEESAKENRDTGFSPDAKAENYSDVYGWQSRAHPHFKELRGWYATGEKVWPESITLTPTVLKHWYCGDGSWNSSDRNNYITIGMANEIKNTEKVDRYFERAGIPLPSNYCIYEGKDGSTNCIARWSVEDSKELWEYIGKPLPGFQYKWPETYHE